MGNYYEPVLSEEQMAAYLDGMLSTEEINMVEELIATSPEMAEIQDAIDSVDSAFILESDEEIPIECLADDFSLPNVDFAEHHAVSSYYSDKVADNEGYHENDDYQEAFNENDYQDDILETSHDDSFLEDGFDDVSC